MFDKLKVLRYIKRGQRFSYLFGLETEYDVILSKASDKELSFTPNFDYNVELKFSDVNNVRRPSLVFRDSNVNVINTEFSDVSFGNLEIRNSGGRVNFRFDDIKKHFGINKTSEDSLNDFLYKTNSHWLLKTSVNAETVGVYGYDGKSLSLLDCNFRAANIVIDGCSSIPFSSIDNMNAYDSISIRNSDVDFSSNIVLMSTNVEIKDSNIKASGIKVCTFGGVYMVDTKIVSSSDVIIDCDAKLSMEGVTALAGTDLNIKASKARIFESINKSSSNVKYDCRQIEIDTSEVDTRDDMIFTEGEIDLRKSSLFSGDIVMDCPDNDVVIDSTILSAAKMDATLNGLHVINDGNICIPADGCDIEVKCYEHDATCMDASCYGVQFRDDEALICNEDSYVEEETEQLGFQYKKSLF